MVRSSRRERLERLKQHLANKYGLAGTILGSLIIFIGVFIVPFSAFTCISCALPVVAALGLTGTVAGLAGKNVYIVGIGVVLLAASGYHWYSRRVKGCVACTSKKRR